MTEGQERGFLPKGLILNLHKYYITHSEYNDIEEYYKHPPEKKDKTYISFGNFDRISFFPVEKFSDYRQETISAYTWLGDRQSIMLYPIMERKERIFGFSNSIESGYRQKEFGTIKAGTFSPLQKKYLMVSFFYTSSKVKKVITNYKKFLEYYKEAIVNVATTYQEKSNNQIDFEVYGSFNSAELAVIWSVNNFSDILYLTDNLRYMEFVGLPKEVPSRAFFSTYTFVAIINTTDSSHYQSIGNALMRLSGNAENICGSNEKTGYESIRDYVVEALKTDGKEPEIKLSAGEFDIITETCSKSFYKLYGIADNELQNNFCVHNPNFCANFIDSSTVPYYTKAQIAKLHMAMSPLWKTGKDKGLLFVKISPHDCKADYVWSTLKIVKQVQQQTDKEASTTPNIRTLYQMLKRKLLGIFSATDGPIQTVDLMYSDYIQCVTANVDPLWVKDFNLQFEAVLKVLINVTIRTKNEDGVSNQEGFSLGEYWELIQETFQVLQQQICHIADSGRRLFKEPRSHFTYTGQYDLLMHAYYGILKALLQKAYTPVRTNNRILPVINFNSTTVLKSKLFVDEVEKKEGRDCLLEISLPYDAWTFLDHYVPMLVHELYHYIEPKSRKNRNYIFACIAVTHLHYRIVNDLLHYALEKVRSDGQAITSQLTKMVYLMSASAHRLIANCFCQYFRSSNNLHYNCEDVSLVQSENMIIDCLEFAAISGKEYLPLLARALLSELKNWGSRELDEDKDKEILKKICREAECVLSFFLDGKTDANEKYFQEYHVLVCKGWKDYGEPILEMLKELFPDVAMICLLGLKVEEYLLQFAIHQNSRLIHPEELTPQTSFRVGCIIDWALGDMKKSTYYVSREGEKDHIGLPEKEKLSEKQAAFVQMYNRLYAEKNGEDIIPAERWFQYFETAYSRYLDFFSFYRPWLYILIDGEYLPCLTNDGEKNEKIESLKAFCSEYYSILKGVNRGSFEQERFDHLICFIQEFQSQPDFGEIKPKTENAEESSDKLVATLCTVDSIYGDFAGECKWTTHLENSGNLQEVLNKSVKELNSTHTKTFGRNVKCRLWYRGCKNANYSILPSIVVHFLDEVNGDEGRTKFDGRNHIGTLYQYQRSLLEEFKFRADGAPEILSSTYSQAEYLALMQHYANYTGFLDWSEDAYSSLYFALEDFIDKKKIKNSNMITDEITNKDAVLYIIDPMLYNRARTQMIEKELESKKGQICTTQFQKLLKKTNQTIFAQNKGYIPNVSFPNNRKALSEFLIMGEKRDGEKAYHKIDKNAKDAVLSDKELREEIFHLPIAIYTSRLNPRIRAQSGIFLAYNLCMLPAWNENNQFGSNNIINSADLFNYMALEEIQRHYLKEFKDENPFLLKIQIKATIKKELGKTLRSLGITRYRIYPELEYLDE